MKPVPQMVLPHVQRWAVWLRAYEYQYRTGKLHANANDLSRVLVREVGPGIRVNE